MIIFIGGISKGQQPDKEEIIYDIDYDVEQIHMDTSLKIVTLMNEEFLENSTDGGGELTGLYKGKRIHKLYVSIGISNGVYITEFYYRKDKLIFVRSKFNAYVYDEKLGTFDYTKINTTFSGRYYFKDNKLIESKVKGSPDPYTENTQAALLDDSSRYSQFVRAKMIK